MHVICLKVINHRNIYSRKKGIRTGNLRLTWYWSGCAETHEMYPSPFTAKTTPCKLPTNSDVKDRLFKKKYERKPCG